MAEERERSASKVSRKEKCDAIFVGIEIGGILEVRRWNEGLEDEAVGRTEKEKPWEVLEREKE